MSNGHYYKELELNLSLDEVLDYLKASYGNILCMYKKSVTI